MGTFIFISIIVGICMIIRSEKIAYKNYNIEGDAARDAYISEHQEDFKKFNISSEEALGKIKSDKKHDNSVLKYFFWISLILFFVALFSMGLADKCFPTASNKKNEIPYTILCTMILLAWGYLSSLIATRIVTTGVKEKIYNRLESYRCPHCKAPLSYFEIDVYDDDIVYFQKKVSKYDPNLRMEYYENENWMKYKEHHIFKCDYCNKRDDIVYDKEKKIDKASLSDITTSLKSLKG